MIAIFPMPQEWVSRCFPDQRAVEDRIGHADLDYLNLPAAVTCGKLFNRARFYLCAAALGQPAARKRGSHLLAELSTAARGLVADAGLKNLVQDQVRAKINQLENAFDSEEFAEAFHREDSLEQRFDNLAGSILASCEMLELTLTRFLHDERQKIAWSFGCSLDQAYFLGPSGLVEVHRRELAMDENATRELWRLMPAMKGIWLRDLNSLCGDLGMPCDLRENAVDTLEQSLQGLESELRQQPKADVPLAADAVRGVDAAGNTIESQNAITAVDEHIAPPAGQRSESKSCEAWEREFPRLELYPRERKLVVDRDTVVLRPSQFRLVKYFLAAVPKPVTDNDLREKWRSNGFGDSDWVSEKTIRTIVSQLSGRFRRLSLKIVTSEDGRRLQHLGALTSPPSRSTRP
jgi:hypothetical protein